MITLKTQSLTGAALDWAVAEAVGFKVETDEIGSGNDMVWLLDSLVVWNPSEEWSQCGLVIERHHIHLESNLSDEWDAVVPCETLDGEPVWVRGIGETPLIAACRAIVAANLGNYVDVPEELL